MDLKLKVQQSASIVDCVDVNKMADIYFYQADNEDDEGFGGGGGEGTSTNPDDELGPIAKLEKYAGSENIFNRQMVARTVLDTLRQVGGSEVDQVFNVVERLAGDTEPSVRAELMEQVPHIAMFCQELPDKLTGTVPVHLLPLVVRFLTDTNNQVRKTSQAALLVLLEQGLVEKPDVEEQVCPVIIRLTEADSMDDYRTEAVALLSKMAPLIGKEMSERLFLDRFACLCTDPLFHVRKVCAANFGDFSGVVGSDATEQILLPKFFYLCEDGVWGVRKACADVFMPVSCVCSPSVRQSELSPLFINLLRDQSRWVRMAAFQALGPFISTFADPGVTALLHNENGEIVITDTEQLADMLAGIVSSPQSSNNSKNNNSSVDRSSSCTNSSDIEGSNKISPMDTEEGSAWNSEQVSTMSESPEERRAHSFLCTITDSVEDEEEVKDFDTFTYWRDPVLEIDLKDIDELEEQDVIQAAVESVRVELSKLDTESSTEGETTETSTEPQASNEAVPHTSNEAVPRSEEEANSILEAHILETLDSIEASSNLAEIDTSTKNEQESSESDSNEKSENESPGELDSIEKEGKEVIVTDSKPSYADATKFTSCRRESTGSTSSQESLPQYTSISDLQPPDPALPKGPPETVQYIVPQLLIDHYVSMIDPSRAQTVDNDIARHCAFSLPAVALTLGRTNWPLLKETYETLANDMQWKVRRTLASSIHELGVILGEEAASADLVPIFNGFIKDLDEVRIGILKHLADFLKLLSSSDRADYLPRLGEFLKMDNQRNWRFRLELTTQLGQLVSLFPAPETREHLAPIALSLVQDKVAAVRTASISVLSSMLASFHSSGHSELADSLCCDLVQALANSPHWARRQTFAALCGLLMERDSGFPPAEFSSQMLPALLELTWDKVPNVRLSLARVLKMSWEVMTDWEQVDHTLDLLKEDKDRDVREACGVQTEITEANICKDPVNQTDLGPELLASS